LAEGVETAAEDAICREVGFTCAQGFFYGRPSQPKSLLGLAPPAAAEGADPTAAPDSPQAGTA
jgi:EAL domain-containing protein (putative c-di-GMP-specific phosphodiesterase class I)